MKKFLTFIASLLVFAGVFVAVIEYLQGKEVETSDSPKVAAKREYITLKQFQNIMTWERHNVIQFCYFYMALSADGAFYVSGSRAYF